MTERQEITDNLFEEAAEKLYYKKERMSESEMIDWLFDSGVTEEGLAWDIITTVNAMVQDFIKRNDYLQVA